MSIPISKVFRNNKLIEVDSSEIVPEDIIQLELGDRVPADAKVLESNNFFVDESFLTGESEPSKKESEYISNKEDTVGDRKDLIFSGSLVVTGKAKAMVTQTGDKTEIGKISTLIDNEAPNIAPLQIKMQKLGKTLGIIAIMAGIISVGIGIAKNIPLETSIMTAISMSVAAIPEVLPVVVTISLAVGMKNMANKKTIVRTPSAVETIGNVSVICSDKTGTLTENKMTVKQVTSIEGLINSPFNITNNEEKNLMFLFYLASSLDNDSTIHINPTELALQKKIDTLFDTEELITITKPFKKIYEIPFDSSRKQMTVVYQYDNQYISVTKGAFDRLNIANENQQVYIEEHNKMANQAYRVLAVAYKMYEKNPIIHFSDNDLETDLSFVGFAGIIDPPRKGSYKAVKTAKKAGIETIMITGDHILTAKRIAENVGILTKNKKVMTGTDLGKLGDQELSNVINDYRVFARTSPEDKIRIVKALQNNNKVVAMTGDGVNDAPALKASDVGFAMGGGTEVAKEAADMILVDDNFETIVAAVKEGRKVYSNIRKSLYSMLGCNLSALSIILISLILGWGAPVTAIQLLIIKVVADGIPGFSLSVEPADQDIMDCKPISKKTSIFSDGLFYRIIEISVLFTLVTLMTIFVGRNQSIELSRTMTFIVLGFSTIAHVYNCRSKESIFKIGLLSNPLVVSTTVFSTFTIILLVSIPLTQKIFGFTSIGLFNWFWVIGLSIIPVAYIEIKKFLHLF